MHQARPRRHGWDDAFHAGELAGRAAEHGMDPRDRRRQRAGLLGRGAV